MGTIRIEYVPVQRFGLGFFGFDHLQLVFQDETDFIDSQDFWYVLEGIQDGFVFGGTLGALGEDGRTTLAAANGANRDALIAKIGTPEDRGSRVLITSSSAIDIWDRLADTGGDIQFQLLPYIAFSLPFSTSPTINWTSFIASVLYSVGINLASVAPFGVRNSPGASTLIGTSEADDLTIGEAFTTLVSGIGNDQLRGSANTFFLEKFYGGEGDDTIHWSLGENLVHGGQSRLAYAADGLDTIDYSGVGRVVISANTYVIEHKIATYEADFNGGHDSWFSIEQVAWDRENDVIVAGDGVSFLERPLLLDLKGSDGGRGDELGFSGTTAPLIINAVNDTTLSIQTVANSGQDAGYWALSVESLSGSEGDDQIYAGAAVLNVDGGKGNDIIDGRLSAAFSGLSESGYDVELIGGDGNDTIVSGSGRTLARGGAGADVFVLSAMTTGEETVEYVIDDGDQSDTLYLPYDFFQATRGDFDGSRLLQVSGAAFKIDDINFNSFFLWGNPGPSFDFNEFVGAIRFTIEGSDLVINPVQGRIEEIMQDNGPGEPPGPAMTVIVGDGSTEATIRVRNWSEGILGITFPLTFDSTQLGLDDDFYDYPGLREIVSNAITPSRFLDPLDARPDVHVPLEIASAIGGGTATFARSAAFAAPAVLTEGGDSDDVLFADTGGPYTFKGYAGNDDITGTSGGDVLDGGSGQDTLRGGRGNDVYFVDNSGDQVIEAAGGGFDRVVSSIDYALVDNVEHLTLAGTASAGTGNALRNTIEGNDLANTLFGGNGDDTLAGNLGDDTLIGGGGGDAYAYELGDGRDTIIDAADGSTADDILLLLGTIAPSDVSLIRNPSAMNDLVLAFADGGRVTLKDYYSGDGSGVESIQFNGGEAWTATELGTRAAAAIVTTNTAPVASDDSVLVSVLISESGAAVVPLAALIDNDSDADGDALSLIAIENVIGGTALIDGDGNLRVMPDVLTVPSTVELTYTISDGRGGTSRATLEVAVRQNTAPVITSAAITPVVEDRLATGAIIARDADGDAVTFAVKAGAGPAKGSVALATDGHFTYTPFADANGDDRFTVTASDGKSAAVERDVSFTIAAVNDAPVAADDAGFTATAGQTLRLEAGTLLANDRDIDGDVIRIAAVRPSTGGTISQDANGDVLFRADGAFNGTAEFFYDVADGQGGFDTASVAIFVERPATANAAPVVTSASLPRVDEDRSAKGRIVATDADGDALSYAIKAGFAPLLGAVSVEANGRFTYRPTADANGPERFTVAVSDGNGGTVDVPFAFNIRPINDAPVAHDDRLAPLASGATTLISELQLLSNDRDVDGDRLDIVSVSRCVGGAAHLTRDGDIVFKAKAGFSGQAQFTYKIDDGHGGSDTATVKFELQRGHGQGSPGQSSGQWTGQWTGHRRETDLDHGRDYERDHAFGNGRDHRGSMFDAWSLGDAARVTDDSNGAMFVARHVHDFDNI